MISFVKASALEVVMDECIKHRERNLLAFYHQSTIKPEPFFFNPSRVLISSISFQSMFSMWKDISKLSDNQSSFLLRLSSIDEITLTHEYAIVRSRNGLCAVYRLSDRSFCCFLNQMDHEVVKSIFINDFENPKESRIIKAVCLKKDNFSRVRCFTCSIGSTDSQEIFENEDISFPGFVEFDSINGRGIVLNSSLTYSIYNLRDFSIEKVISGHHIRDVKFVPNLLIITKESRQEKPQSQKELEYSQFESIFLEMHSFDGDECTIELKVFKGKKIQFIDSLGSNIIIKQVGYNARVYDAGTHLFTEIPYTAELKISDFLFLYKARKFFIHRHGTFDVFSFSGEFLFSITSSSSKRSLDSSPAAVSRNQDFLAACSHAGFDQFIYLFSLKDGSLIWKRRIPPNQNNGYKITAISFDELTCTLVTGDEGGRIAFYQ